MSTRTPRVFPLHRLYRLLLRVYPRPFLTLYRDELEADFADLLRRARAQGRNATMRFCVRMAVDTLRAGLRERVSRRGYRVGRSRLRVPRHGLTTWVADAHADTRYALRALGRTPGYAAAVIVTLGLGIGATTALFSVVYGTLLRPLPFQDGERLIHLVQEQPVLDDPSEPLSQPGFSVRDLDAYRSRVPAFREVSEYHSMVFTLIDSVGPHRVRAGVVSANYFDFLGLRALHGRVLRPDEDHLGADPVIVLSHAYWTSRFGADPAVVGRRVRMNDRVHEIVGVLPPTSQFPVERDLFLPVSACPTRSDPAFMADATSRMMFAYARLAPGVDIDQAGADADSVLTRLYAESPEAYPVDEGFRVRATPLRDEMVASVRPLAVALLVIALFLLLVACANAAGLALARVGRRGRELAVRGALGAGRGRLLRTLVTESVVLALAGGAMGVLLAVAGHDLLVEFAGRFTTRAGEIRLDRTVLGFTLVTSIVTGLVFGSVPGLWLGRRRRPNGDAPGVVTEAVGDRRWQRALVVTQVGVAYAVVALAGLAARTAWIVGHSDLGYETESLATFQVGADYERYGTLSSATALFDTLTRRLRAHPDVEGAVRTVGGPLGGHRHRDAYFLHRAGGGDSEPVTALSRVGDVGLFEMLGIEVLSGRDFDQGDQADQARVAVVNRTFHDRYMAGRFGLGTTMTRCHEPGDCDPAMKVVGVVEDVRLDGPDQEVTPEVYEAGRQAEWGGEQVLVRVRGDAAALEASLTAVVHDVDPDLAVSSFAPLEALRREHTHPRRFLAMLLGVMATVAAGLAVTGIFGVASLAASARTRELGIRRVLGAAPGSLRRLVLREGIGVTLAGLALGVALTWASGYALVRFLERILWGIPPHDPVTLVATALVLGGVALLAAWLPARRAGAVDVMRILDDR